MQLDIKTDTRPEIDDYEIIEKIGQGGIAEIYKARQKSLGRHVAIKVLFPDLINDPDIVRRFDREANTIAALNHPNIVHVIDKGIAAGRYYFIMEHVDGTSFKEIIGDSKYSIQEKLELLVMVLKGLDYAHKNGVIHRDIKPANILIDKNGNALLADFGIARVPGKGEQENTKSDIIMGTIAYMSPEQRESSASVDLTTDIFSIGVMIYEILVGKRPAGRFKLPSEVNSTVSRRFDDIIARCLAESPADRYQTAVELKNDLLNVISGRARSGAIFKGEIIGVENLIGKCQHLDTIRDSKFSSTVLVENKETRELYIIKKNEKSGAGLKESRILANLKHKNIINILGAGGDNRRLIVMTEYAPGGSLADRMIRPYPYDKAMEIMIEVAEGLDFVHKNNIVHGNLRPSNILFTKENRVKLTDFGLPPHYNMAEKNWYVAPERRNSRQGDIYAMGVILHQMLFGKNPVYDRAGKLFLGNLQKTIPAPLYEIMNKLLAIRTTQRYRAIDEFLNDWDAFKVSITHTHAPLETPPARKISASAGWLKKLLQSLKIFKN
ncbi:Serine/threonine protein kinase [Candidatus Zixiibacteriota bacterium]|nr:Serine/threonine protein kinase [candidate division Zixibacteria bacterium]